jgi:alanyl-tRNA synthetase
VTATGDIGTIKIVSEGSIGSNLRRIEAVTGANTVRLMQGYDDVLARASALVGAKPEELVAGVERRIEELRAAQDEVKVLRARLATGRAAEISARAESGVLVERIDGLAANDLRDLAVAVRQQGVGIVVLCGVTDAGGVSLVAAVNQAAGVQAGELIKDAARSVGGGGGGKGDVATAGGKNPDGIDEALRIAGEKARAASARS